MTSSNLNYLFPNTVPGRGRASTFEFCGGPNSVHGTFEINIHFGIQVCTDLQDACFFFEGT